MQQAFQLHIIDKLLSQEGDIEGSDSAVAVHIACFPVGYLIRIAQHETLEHYQVGNIYSAVAVHIAGSLYVLI